MSEKNGYKQYTAADLSPVSYAGAMKLLHEGFRPVAGGTDLVVRNHALKKASGRTAELPPLFSTRKIAGNSDITAAGGVLNIGAAVTLAEIIENPLCPPVLHDSLLSVASPGIRNIATLAGNICNASPAADSLPALYCLDAVISAAVTADDGSIMIKTFPIQDFITGPGKIITGGASLVTGISFRIPEYSTYVFRKVGTRAANALSKLSVAAVWRIEDKIITEFKLAVGACAPTVVRSTEAEKILCGKPAAKLNNEIEQAVKIYDGLLNPINDQRSTADYRKNTALKLIKNIIMTMRE